MSEQVVDVRSVWAILRRHWKALLAAAVLGAAGGAVALAASPVEYTSSSSVLLPTATQPGSSRIGGYDPDTQMLIAKSTDVLERAGQALEPPLSASDVQARLMVEAPATSVLQFTARGDTAQNAQALSNAVADSLVGFLGGKAYSLSETQQATLQERADTLTASLNALNEQMKQTAQRLKSEAADSPQGRADAAALADLTASRAETVLELDSVKKQLDGADVTDGQVPAGATVIRRATLGVQPGQLARRATFTGGGAALAVLAAFVWFFISDRRDPRLRFRDQIANTLGIAVVAMIQSRSAQSGRAWHKMLASHGPYNAEGWALRQLLRSVTPGTPGSLVPDAGLESDFPPVIVISLSDDQAALAAAPQFASFAAAIGVNTELVAAHHDESVGGLRPLSSRPSGQQELREGLIVGTRQEVNSTGKLVVVMAVLDRQAPQLRAMGVENAVTLLAVRSGGATADDLARAAIAADLAGHPIDGVIVVDPDPADRTFGRLAPHERQPEPVPADASSSLAEHPTRAGRATVGQRASRTTRRAQK